MSNKIEQTAATIEHAGISHNPEELKAAQKMLQDMSPQERLAVAKQMEKDYSTNGGWADQAKQAVDNMFGHIEITYTKDHNDVESVDYGGALHKGPDTNVFVNLHTGIGQTSEIKQIYEAEHP